MPARPWAPPHRNKSFRASFFLTVPSSGSVSGALNRTTGLIFDLRVITACRVAAKGVNASQDAASASTLRTVRIVDVAAALPLSSLVPILAHISTASLACAKGSILDISGACVRVRFFFPRSFGAWARPGCRDTHTCYAMIIPTDRTAIPAPAGQITPPPHQGGACGPGAAFFEIPTRCAACCAAASSSSPRCCRRRVAPEFDYSL